MKAKDLMIGAFVYFNCFDGSKIIVRVTGFKDGIVYGNSENGSHWCELEKVEPIPFTPEILEKNEFTSQPNIGYIIDDYDGMQIIYDDWNHNLRIIKNYKVCLDIETFDVISVHELQHALRFCGIEKEITL